MRTNATYKELDKALKIVNKKYNNNIEFNRQPQTTHYNKLLNFTLKVKDSKKAGHRLGQPKKDYSTGETLWKGRRLINACWHVHGDFFEALFNIRDDIFIYSGKDKITSNSGNWEDKNIGSQMYPFYFSEACECK